MMPPKAEDRPSDEAIADWVVKTCLIFGASVSTAHAIAATFVDGVNDGRAKKSLK